MRVRILLAAAFLVAGSVSVSAQTTADAVRSWITAVDQSDEWDAQYATLTEDATNNSATVTGLAIYAVAEGGVRFDFDTINVKGLAPNTGAGFGADEVDVGRITITSKYFNGSLDGTKLTGFFSPSVIGTVLESDDPQVIVSRLHELVNGLRLDRGFVENFAAKYQVMGETTEITYEAFEVVGLANGRSGAMNTGPMRQVAETPEGPLVSVIRSSTSQSTDFGTMLRLLDPYNPPSGDDSWQNLMPIVLYRGLAWQQGETKVAIDEMSMENFRMRKPAPSYAPAVKRLLESWKDMPASEYTPLAGHLAVDILEAFSLGRIGVRNVDATGPDVDRVRLNGFTLSELSLAGIGEISVDGLAVSVPGAGDFGLERFALGGIVFPPADVLRAGIEAEEQGQEVDPFSFIPQIGFLEVLRANGALADGIRASLDRLRLELKDHVNAIPTAATADLRGLEIPVAALPDSEARQALAGIGVEKLSVNYGYRVRWREADERLLVDDIHLELEDLGSVTLSLTLGGLKRDMLNLKSDPEQILQNLTFEEVRIVYEDRSATDRAIKYFAQQQGTDPETLRQETADAIPLTLRMAIENDGLRSKIAPALKAFLLKPGRMTVTLRAKEPMPIAALVAIAELAPDTLSDMFDIEVQQE
jgi:hypothetical protein